MSDRPALRLRKRSLRHSALLLAAGLALGLAPARAADDQTPAGATSQVTAGLATAVTSGPLVSRIAPFDRAGFTAAVEHYRKGQVSTGDALAEAVSDESARVALEWLAIRLNPGTIRFARIQRFIAQYPDWPNIAVLQRRAEEALSAERLDAATTLDFFRDRPALTPVGRLALASALRDSGSESEGQALARAIWHRDPLSAATEAILLSRFGGTLTAEDHRIRTRTFLLKEQAATALRAAQRVSSDYVRLAQAQLAAQNKGGGAERLLSGLPKEMQADPAFVFTQAMLHRRANRPEEAFATFRQLSASAALGDGDGWWTERRLIARKLLDAGQAEKAYAIAADHAAEGASARLEAEFHAGWIALRFLKEPERALPHFQRMTGIAITPHAHARAHYWSARVLQQQGTAAEAVLHLRLAARHGATYHGQLARESLGERHYMPAQATVKPTLPSLTSRAVLLLQQAQATDMALTLAQDMAQARYEPGRLATLAERLPLSPAQRLALGRIAHARALPLEETAYPTDGIPPLPVASDVETPILHAIARQESAFNAHAVSGAGARGLMQLMPATARETARRFALAYDPRRLTGDPAYSATLGAAHLSDLLKSWRGSYVLTFAAYNAGSGNVKDWIAAYGDPRDPQVDVIDWIERIPFSETRHYVQKILENLQVYRARLEGRGDIRIAEDLRRGEILPVASFARPAADATHVAEAAWP